jgi:antitoxin ParD1/3/4
MAGTLGFSAGSPRTLDKAGLSAVPLGDAAAHSREQGMSAEPTVPLTERGYDIATSLVAAGRFATLSAVVQHGLALVAREEEEREARLAVIRADLDRRAGRPSISMEEMDERLAAWRARRDAGDDSDLA